MGGGLKDQLLENALLWKRVKKGPLGPWLCCLRPFDAAEDAGVKSRGLGGVGNSRGPGNGLQTSGGSQAGSIIPLLGACLGSLTPFSLG